MAISVSLPVLEEDKITLCGVKLTLHQYLNFKIVTKMIYSVCYTTRVHWKQSCQYFEALGCF